MTMLVLRAAAVVGDAATLRTTIRELDALREAVGGTLDEPRTKPQVPALAQLAWLEGRARRRDRAVGERRCVTRRRSTTTARRPRVRVRLARALVRQGDLVPAAKLLQSVFERAAADDAPGGALLAGEALAEVASVEWGSALEASQRAKLRLWAQMTARSPERGPAPPLAPETLSPRELDVLRRIATGDSNKLIARAFDLSPHTVKRHVANILDKLGGRHARPGGRVVPGK
jgi:LuxR family maltose regulon positive regulatory protein